MMAKNTIINITLFNIGNYVDLKKKKICEKLYTYAC